MMRESPHGQPTHSNNKSKKHFYRKQAINPNKEGIEEHTHQPPERDYHSLSSDNSLSPCRKKQRNDDNLQREFKNIRDPTYEREMNTRERVEEWFLGMRKYFQVHSYSSEMKSHLEIYNLNGKASRW